MRKPITDYELIDHGIDGAQYFQGYTTSFTKFNRCETGCGANFAEALDDCFEQIASDGEYEIDGLEDRIKKDDDVTEWPTKPNTNEYHAENEDSEMYYYVSIRLR